VGIVERKIKSVEKVQGIALPKQVVLFKNLLFCLSQAEKAEISKHKVGGKRLRCIQSCLLLPQGTR
jgi:hypothetical protein